MTDSLSTAARRSVAGFSAALAGAAAAAPAEAAIVDLTATRAAPVFPAGDFFVVTSTGGFVNNPYLANSTGQGLIFDRLGTYGNFLPGGSLGAGMLGKFTTAGATVAPGFAGQTFAATVPGAPGASGTFYAAFETRGLNGFPGGRVGWLKIVIDSANTGRLDAAITAGALQTLQGGSIVVGQGAEARIPLPATLPLAALGTLALGAAGLRRKRRAAAGSA